jgi:hypothetical protein
MKKSVFAIIFSLLLLFNILSLANMGTSISKASSNSADATGSVQIKVLESATLAPVLNATVCIIETRTYEQTDKYGNTAKITVPIISNSNFDISHPRTWGEITILVYKQGYSSLISFYNQVYPSTTRVGLVCYLSPIINSTDPSIITNAVTPDADWTELLVALYKK